MHSPTLLLTLLILMTLITSVSFLAWRLTHYEGLREWFLAFVSSLSGIVYFLQNYTQPSAVFYLVLHGLLLSTGALSLIGTYRFLGRTDTPYLTIGLIVLLTLAGLGIFGQYVNDPILVYRLHCIVAGGLFIWTGGVIWPKQPQLQPSRVLFTTITVLHGLFMCARIFFSVQDISSSSLSQIAWNNAQLIMIEQMVMVVLFGFSIMLLVNEHSEAQLKMLADLDSLTNLYNRRAYLKSLGQAISFANRSKQALSVLVIDVDHFKNINDSFGHDTGDVVLQRIAQIIQSCLRAEDVMGRMGGEEFSVCLPNTDLESALVVAERIRSAIQENPVSLEFGDISCSVSIGISPLRALESPREVLRRSDQAMYFAKASGRNCIEYAL